MLCPWNLTEGCESTNAIKGQCMLPFAQENSQTEESFLVDQLQIFHN